METDQSYQDPDTQRTDWTRYTTRQASGWSHINSLVDRQRSGVGRHDSGHICSVKSSILVSEAARAAFDAAVMTCTKYRELDITHIFVPIAIETAGILDIQAAELVEEIGRWCTLTTDYPKETIYLHQRITIAIQT